MQCARHPQTETELTCGRCGTPICPRCLVHTPVGARCPDCARATSLPTYQISLAFLLRGGLASACVGAIGGLLWAMLFPFSLGFIFGILLGALLGYSIGSAVSWATNRKRGPTMQLIAGAGVILAYVVRSTLESAVEGHSLALDNDLGGIILVAIAIVVAVNQLR